MNVDQLDVSRNKKNIPLKLYSQFYLTGVKKMFLFKFRKLFCARVSTNFRAVDGSEIQGGGQYFSCGHNLTPALEYT